MSNVEILPKEIGDTNTDFDGLPTEKRGENSGSLRTQFEDSSEAKKGTAVSNGGEEISPPASVLARYSIPLGENEATLAFTGKSLSPEDFDALIDFVGLFKKKFLRRQGREVPTKEIPSDENPSDRAV